MNPGSRPFGLAHLGIRPGCIVILHKGSTVPLRNGTHKRQRTVVHLHFQKPTPPRPGTGDRSIGIYPSKQSLIRAVCPVSVL